MEPIEDRRWNCVELPMPHVQSASICGVGAATSGTMITMALT